MKRCRHNRAWPTIYAGTAGFMWCPDCGAVRQIKCNTGSNSFAFSEPRWIRPGPTWEKDMEANRTTEEEK